MDGAARVEVPLFGLQANRSMPLFGARDLDTY
jgi:hypothetical protein